MTQPTFKRETFITSRLMEFFSQKELIMQIGHTPNVWPIALVKELIDNSLDACESAGIAPVIKIEVAADSVTVTDNGPGLPSATLTNSLDYANRVSDKNGYVAPTRGQLGNALKCVWAAPFVVSKQESAIVEVNTAEASHLITVQLDRIAQQPAIMHTQGEPIVKSGTSVKMYWPGVAGYLGTRQFSSFYNQTIPLVTLVKNYALFNRHATFHLCESGQKPIVIEATGTIDKWSPSSPTSPHWYTFEQLRSLIAAYINKDRQTEKRTTVREFVSNFRGLSGTQKQKTVTEVASLSGAYLDEVVTGNDIDGGKVSHLLAAMQAESKLDKPTIFGAIGEAHMRFSLVNHAYIADRTFEYRCKRGVIDGRPYVLEVAFGVNRKEYSKNGRLLSVGLNWTPTLYNPIRGLADMLGENQADQDDPVAVVVHLSYPSVEFTDRGKSSATLPREIQTELTSAITAVTKSWKRLVNQHAKQARLTEKQIQEEYKRERSKELSITAACRLVIEEAYMIASSNNTLPANSRQVMYQARPRVLAMTGKFFQNSDGFTQEFLPDFQRDNPELTESWDVVYDDRGHLTEPHTGHSIGLGTINVRNYISEWHSGQISHFNVPVLSTSVSTLGPSNRYKFVLFIEKEGFNALISHARIAEKYDIAIQSTKGQTVTAARQLAEEFTRVGVTVLVLHDFDKSGIEIVEAYRGDTRRYQYEAKPNIIDIGLSLADATAMGLQSEQVRYKKGKDPRENLRKCGATKAECNFLVREGNESVGWSGERIELNAMTSQQFIDFIERKLIEHGVTKLIPNRDLLETAYINAYKTSLLQDIINREARKIAEMEIDIPSDLAESVASKAAGTDRAWDDAVSEIAHRYLPNEE